MAKVMRASADLGSRYPQDITSKESERTSYYPQTVLSDPYSPIVFVIEGTPYHYLQFETSELALLVRILDANGKPFLEKLKTVPSFDFLSSIFSGVEIEQNGTLISSSATLYPYRSHIRKLLSYDFAIKQHEAQSEMWFEDTLTDDFEKNDGFISRFGYSNKSTPFRVIGRISESLFEQKKYTPSGVTTRIVLRRSPPQFCCEGLVDATYEIMSAKFSVRRHLVEEQVVSRNDRLPELYFQHYDDIPRAFNIKAGTSNIISEAIYRGRIPSYLVVTFISTVAFQGDKSKQCFNFQPFNLGRISVRINGDTKILETVNFNFGGNDFFEGYQSLRRATDLGHNHGIHPDRYKDGQFLVVLDINPNDSINATLPEKEGTTQLDISFQTGLIQDVTCIVLGRFQSEYYFDKNKNVIKNDNGL